MIKLDAHHLCAFSLGRLCPARASAMSFPHLDGFLNCLIAFRCGTVAIERDVHSLQSVKCAGDCTDAAIKQDWKMSQSCVLPLALHDLLPGKIIQMKFMKK